ncbi:hypothetical protein [Gloeobacter violaceus]|uniref:Gll1433 protein n=1 Tax=Gloeobacter violaceus (strain ATCC 29082 / PCC 7421) TaxID=251221 RepID=Q7NKP4_GLOVI|nr:hypothetical protein [Gloeobacter violaceus]BAC89374.1 gll1433 [Gloeobacter violaceus PCC 7421]
MDKQLEQRLHALELCLLRLAAPADEQAAYLEKLGVSPSADELALEFDDSLAGLPVLVEKRLLTPRQAELVYAVDRRLTQMSEQQTLWTEEALHHHQDWAQIRELAALSLREMAA